MKKFLFFCSLFFVFSCGSHLQYLGDTYAPNPGKLDVYFDPGDATKEYTVIGKLVGRNYGNSLDYIKMI